jgi:hypothetical protein
MIVRPRFAILVYAARHARARNAFDTRAMLLHEVPAIHGQRLAAQ